MRKRNSKVFTEILDNMPQLTYKTTWAEAQTMLLDNPVFADDRELQCKCMLNGMPSKMQHARSE